MTKGEQAIYLQYIKWLKEQENSEDDKARNP